MAEQGLDGPFSIARRQRVSLLAFWTKKLGTHPELAYRIDRLLVSINDRLGDGDGEDIEPLGQEPLDDLLSIMQLEARHAADLEEELET